MARMGLKKNKLITPIKTMIETPGDGLIMRDGLNSPSPTRYDDILQRERILSVRGGLLKILTEELAEEVEEYKDGKPLKMPRARKMIQESLRLFSAGDIKPFELVCKMSGLLDTALLEMNFIQDQRRLDRTEKIDVTNLEPDEQNRLFDLLTKVTNTTQNESLALEIIEDSGRELEDPFDDTV